jgi:hypothetical protein
VPWCKQFDKILQLGASKLDFRVISALVQLNRHALVQLYQHALVKINMPW